MSEYLLKNALNLRISTKRFQIDVKSWHTHLDRGKYRWIERRCNLGVVWSIAHVVEHVLPVFTREDVYSHRVSSTDCLARLNYLHLLDLHRVKKLININFALFISFRIYFHSFFLLTGQGRYICQFAKQFDSWDLTIWLYLRTKQKQKELRQILLPNVLFWLLTVCFLDVPSLLFDEQGGKTNTVGEKINPSILIQLHKKGGNFKQGRLLGWWVFWQLSCIS